MAKGARLAPLSGEKDCVRPWLPGLKGPGGEEKTVDLGRPVNELEPGDGEGEFREITLLCRCDPPPCT